MKHETTTHETAQNKYFCYKRWLKICFCFCVWWKLRALIVSVLYFNSQPVPWPEGAALLPLAAFRWDSLFWRWSGRGAGEQQQNKLNLWGWCHLVLQRVRPQTGARDTIWSDTDTKTSIWTVIFCFMGLTKKKMFHLRDRSQFQEGVLRHCTSICSPIKCLENSWYIHFKKNNTEVHKQFVFFVDRQGVWRLPSTIMFWSVPSALGGGGSERCCASAA